MRTDTRRSTPPPAPRDSTEHPKSGWLVIVGLLTLSTLPVIGGALRLGEVGAGDAPGAAATVAIVVHIVGMTLFCVVGAFQFSPALRVGRRWHRMAGRVLFPAGLLAALAAIWLALFFDGPAAERPLAIVRLLFSAAMAVFLVAGARSIVRRDIPAHRAWLVRAFALAVSGGTQAVFAVLWSIPFGEPDTTAETWLIAAGFVTNGVIAEMLIRRRPRQAAPRSTSGRALVS